MAVAHQHAEWQKLIDVSGPFLSMQVLTSTFPQGLEKLEDEKEVRTRFQLALGEWEDAAATNPAIHRAFVRLVLEELLGYSDELCAEGQSLPGALTVHVPVHGETLRPDIAVLAPADAAGARSPRLLVVITSPGQNLDKPVAGKRWKASPAARMMELCHGANVRLGLVTNGEDWLLVHAPRNETATYATFYARLFLEEPLALRAFRTLLSAQRLFGVPENETLEALFAESEKYQQEVTEQLGYQVRHAVEVLVQAIDRVNRDRQGRLLAGVDEKRLYEAAVTVMMRLVFLFAAEERGLIRVGGQRDEEDDHYSVSSLGAQLRDEADRHGEELLERRASAWCRLLATWRAVHGGVQHESMRLPAYGGSLFDPDRFPFLEGRAAGTSWRDTPADPLPISDRDTLHLLEALQLLEVKVAGGGPAEGRRLSFRALDVEQIGHVYEGLLDHTAVRATSPVLGLVGTKDKEPEVALGELEELRAQGGKVLVTKLREATDRSENALKNALEYAAPEVDPLALTACDNDHGLYERVRPFAGLVRNDRRGYPVVINAGSVYVTQGSDRRTTGTHYTPQSLTRPIVEHTLEPLVYEGPAEGQPREEWRLRSARELLGLRVCDIAMGSGAFLVQACRYLSERLCESWEDAEKGAGGRVVITPEGDLSQGHPTERPLPRDPAERLTIARRFVADRCLFGVDKNPMAVEMGKLSLWLVTLQKEHAFTFLDHALRCGDSLVGLTSPEQLENFHIDPSRGRQIPLFAAAMRSALRKAVEKRRTIEARTVDTIRDAEDKARLLREAEATLAEIRVAADLIIGAAMEAAGRGASSLDLRLQGLARDFATAFAPSVEGARRDELFGQLRQRADELLNAGVPYGQTPRLPFHWLLEFPEVFLGESGAWLGFNAIVGNPPFLGGQRLTGVLGTDYRNYLVEHLAGGQRGSADLCAYFFLRANRLLADDSGFGLLATNSIAQGDTREVGLEQIAREGAVIPWAVPSRRWPGTANLEVAHVWVRRGAWRGEYFLDERQVAGITPFLVEPGAVAGKPFRLAANAGSSFQGSIVLGLGFVLAPDEADGLMARDPRNRDVLCPYLNGEDVNSSPDQSPSRWVINFRDWPLDRLTAPHGYVGPVADDYLDCLDIVRQRVKPERDGNTYSDSARRNWWLYERLRPELYATIRGSGRVLVRSRHANLNAIAVLDEADTVYSEAAVVFHAGPDYSRFAELQSSVHTAWLELHASSLRTDIRYTPSDCFDTFPFSGAAPTVSRTGSCYESFRRAIMLARGEGLTKTYNRLNNPDETAEDIAHLRALHAEMDQGIAAAYGWTDLDLGHGFHQTKQGLRYTISEVARREVIGRLLRLNHARHAEEVAAGLVDGDKTRKTRATRATKARKKQDSSDAKKPAGDFKLTPDPAQGRFKF